MTSTTKMGVDDWVWWVLLYDRTCSKTSIRPELRTAVYCFQVRETPMPWQGHRRIVLQCPQFQTLCRWICHQHLLQKWSLCHCCRPPVCGGVTWIAHFDGCCRWTRTTGALMPSFNGFILVCKLSYRSSCEFVSCIRNTGIFQG